MNCATCRRAIEQGMDVYELQDGIMGLQGIVPLEGALLFCSEECLKGFFNGAKGRLSLKRRVP